MRKPLEMYVASRMQHIVQIRAWDACFASKLFLIFVATIIWGGSALRALTVGGTSSRNMSFITYACKVLRDLLDSVATQVRVTQ